MTRWIDEVTGTLGDRPTERATKFQLKTDAPRLAVIDWMMTDHLFGDDRSLARLVNIALSRGN